MKYISRDIEGGNMDKKIKITTESILAYSQCKRKAFLTLIGENNGVVHEHVNILFQQKQENQSKYIQDIKKRCQNVKPFDKNYQSNNADFIIYATLCFEKLEGECGLLSKVENSKASDGLNYEPTIFTGTYSITKEHHLELLYIAYILGKIQNNIPRKGKIIGLGNNDVTIVLANKIKTISPMLELLQDWLKSPSPEPPPIILNKHCHICQFRSLCNKQAVQEDNLSLLSSITTSKQINKYEKRGIFTVKQLSFLFRPRKPRKRVKELPVVHKPELHALALKTGKIYVQELPNILRKPVELFLDIEGVPDRQFHYLIGLLICENGLLSYQYFWSATSDQEFTIWQDIIRKINEYSQAPIYHYGNYEVKAFEKAEKRFGIDTKGVIDRFINLNRFIYGKIYFPVLSNGLKDICKHFGFSWTDDLASGIQSLIWRHYWEKSHSDIYKHSLITYNHDDCKALVFLIDKLSTIKVSADSLSEVDFANQPKQNSTLVGQEIHDQFDKILKFAHLNYEKNKLNIKIKDKDDGPKEIKIGGPIGHQAYKRITPKTKKTVCVDNDSINAKCPEHQGTLLKVSNRIFERTLIDLVFTNNGVRKTIIRYTGHKLYCDECKKYYFPAHFIDKKNQLFDHGFQVWAVYQRMYLRLPYRIIAQVILEQFNEGISEGTLVSFFKYFADYYSDTEKNLIQKIKASPFVHVDETKINIQGLDCYTWVFTDGKHVIFRLTDTREATIVNDLLSDYNGVLVSDFYGGYDSFPSKQQKCWVHLIRDINEDLFKAPFDTEFEKFVWELKKVITPIFQAIDTYGLKKIHFNKFITSIESFYEKYVNSISYKSELTIKYQKRLKRYQNSLFTFLSFDGIPWNNNMAERSIRHLAVQRKISTHFHESGATNYLLLLGIMQTCRFQNKSFLRFLLSKEKDIDKFKKTRRKKFSEAIKK